LLAWMFSKGLTLQIEGSSTSFKEGPFDSARLNLKKVTKIHRYISKGRVLPQKAPLTLLTKRPGETTVMTADRP